MIAIQYLRKYGLANAKAVVDTSPDGALSYYIPLNMYVLPNKYWGNELNQWKPISSFTANGSEGALISIPELTQFVESLEIMTKFESVQDAKDAIANAPDGATEFRKLSCSTRYIKVGPRFFEYWDGVKWCRPTVPFTDETHILRFTELSRLEQAIKDHEIFYRNLEQK